MESMGFQLDVLIRLHSYVEIYKCFYKCIRGEVKKGNEALDGGVWRVSRMSK